ncbi:translation initiation factor eIF3 subunit [Ramaria rubella]|nr:translation initiation factor eIF3 subunit [Ramaria rubella]
MTDDWGMIYICEAGSSEGISKAAKIIPRKKWEGEDEDEDSAPDDWEASSSEEEDSKLTAAPVAPPRKKGTLKAKIAEKEAAKASLKDADGDSDLEDVAASDPAEKKRLDRERELKADLSNAADLFGTVAIDCKTGSFSSTLNDWTAFTASSSSKELDSLLNFNPRTKEDFQQLSTRIIDLITKRHESKPLYPSFIEHHVKALAQPLKDVEVRKAASALTTLANEKQKEQRDKASGKKKSKATTKPALGAAKSSNKFDTNIYEESLDDFGTNADDFM